MARFYLLEDFLSDIFQPIGRALAKIINHPIDSIGDVANSAIDIAKEHPYTCAAVVGLGAYAYHRGWIKVDRNRVSVNINVNTPIFGYNTNTTFRLGRR